MLSKSEFDRLFPLACVPESIAPYMNKGEWAIHDVLPFLLDEFGPCELRIITFNISVESLHEIVQHEAKLTKIKMLLDTSIQRNKLDLLLFAQNISGEVHLDKVHAKLFLLSNEKYKFGIAGSANFNSNKRLESGFYFTADRYFDYFFSEYEINFDNAIIK